MVKVVSLTETATIPSKNLQKQTATIFCRRYFIYSTYTLWQHVNTLDVAVLYTEQCCHHHLQGNVNCAISVAALSTATSIADLGNTYTTSINDGTQTIENVTLLGVQRLTKYVACRKCDCKVTAQTDNSNLGVCTKCSVTQFVDKAPRKAQLSSLFDLSYNSHLLLYEHSTPSSTYSLVFPKDRISRTRRTKQLFFQ